EFFGRLNDLNEVVAGFFPLLLTEPDEIVLSYREMKEKIGAARGIARQSQSHATHQDEDKESRVAQKRHAPKRKNREEPGARPKLNYYRPASATVIDRVTRAQDFRVWTVPASIKDLYEEHGRELTKAQRAWLQYAKETWAKKSTMRLVPSDENGIVQGYLTQK